VSIRHELHKLATAPLARPRLRFAGYVAAPHATMGKVGAERLCVDDDNDDGDGRVRWRLHSRGSLMLSTSSDGREALPPLSPTPSPALLGGGSIVCSQVRCASSLYAWVSCGPHAPHAAPFEFRRLLKRGGADNEFRNVSTSGNPNPTTKKQTKMGDREEVTLCRQDGQRWGTHIMHAMNSFVVHLGVRVEPLHALLRTRLQMSSRCPDVMCTRTTINLHAHGTHFSSVGSVCAGASMVSTACLAHPPRRLSLRFCNSDSSIV
jgi:hypothetical protein